MSSLVGMFEAIVNNSAFWGLVGTCLGGFLAYRTAVYTQNSSSALHKEEYKLQRTIQYHQLQMDELLMIQELINKWGRSFAEYYLSVQQNISNGIANPALPFGDEKHDEEMRVLYAEITQHSSRLMNDTIRVEIEKAIDIIGEPKTLNDYNAFMLERFATLDTVQAHVGSEYRRHLHAISPVSEDEV